LSQRYSQLRDIDSAANKSKTFTMHAKTAILALSYTAHAFMAPMQRPMTLMRRSVDTIDRETTAAAVETFDLTADAEIAPMVVGVEPAGDAAPVLGAATTDAAADAAADSGAVVAVDDAVDAVAPMDSGLSELLIKWGFKEDSRIPEAERVSQMDRIKASGKAGIVAYALTEGAFWLGSIPFAVAAVTLATGSFPDIGTDAGKAAIGTDVFVFINFARLIVPARIALALGLAPWVDENILARFGGGGGGDDAAADE